MKTVGIVFFQLVPPNDNTKLNAVRPHPIGPNNTPKADVNATPAPATVSPNPKALLTANKATIEN